MLEYWSGKAENGFPKRNVESTFFDDARQASIFWFFPLKHSIKQENH